MGGVRWRVDSLAQRNVLRLCGTALVIAGALLLPGSSAGRSNQAATCFGQPATIVGTPGDDTLIGTDGNDVIAGLAGNDTIDGRGGFDIICAGPGDDHITGRGGIFFGEEGNDTIDGSGGDLIAVEGGPGNDTLIGGGFTVVSYVGAPFGVTVDLQKGFADGGDGHDTLRGFNFVFGSNHDDTLIGNKGLNDFFAAGGNDTIRGGGGFDTVGFQASETGVRANLTTGRSFGGLVEGNDTLIGIDGLFGGNGPDTFVGNAHDNFLSGNGGGDVIHGGGGADAILGGDGNDQLHGGGGNDVLEGDAGRNTIDGGPGANDEVTYDWVPSDVQSTTGVNVDLAAGTANGPGFHDTLTRIESVNGSNNADVLAGNAQANALIGNGGDDTLDGRGGDDFLNGGPGIDTADAGAGTDYCLDTEPTVHCEVTATTEATLPATWRAEGSVLSRLLASLCGGEGCLPQQWSGLAWPWSELAAVPLDSLIDHHDEPTCKPNKRGGGVVSIAPPRSIKILGGNNKAEWQATLYRFGSPRPVETTPLAEGDLVAPGQSAGQPSAWTNERTGALVGRRQWVIHKPGVYYWQERATLKPFGTPHSTGRACAYFQPPGSASARLYCDFRGAGAVIRTRRNVRC